MVLRVFQFSCICFIFDLAQLQSICLDSSEVVTIDSPGRSRAYTEGVSAIDGDDTNSRVRQRHLFLICIWVCVEAFCLIHSIWLSKWSVEFVMIDMRNC